MLLKKLYKHLRKLSAKEERQFLRWLQSPYHNGNRNLEVMFAYIRKSSPLYEGARLQPESIYQALYPQKKYKEIRIKQLGVEMLNQLNGFWTDQAQQEREIDRELLLWPKLHHAGLPSAAKGLKSRCHKRLFEHNLHRDSDNLRRFQFAMEEHQQILQQGKRDLEPKLQEVNDTLDRHYYYEKLKHYCKSLVQGKFTKSTYQFPLVEEILLEIQREPYLSLHGLQFYRHAIQAFQQEHDPAYFEMKKILFEQRHAHDPEELPQQLLLARNYCIQRLNNRARDFLPELFAIYELEIDLELIVVRGQIPQATYKNIATLSMMLKRYDWLERFLHRYRTAVDEGSYFFNLAILRFIQGNYKETLDLLAQADNDEVLMNLSAKTWQLKTYFELWLKYSDESEYDEKLEAHLTAFTTFLNRKKSSLPNHYHYHLNFGKFVRELLRKSQPYQKDKHALQKLLDKVNANEQLADRAWLLEKVQDLLKTVS